MAEQTNISWTHHTHNHWIGCTKVSPACDGCYAEAMMDKRYGRVQWGAPGKGNGTRVLTSEANRKKPLSWDRKAAKEGTRPFVFCSSLADVFDNQVPKEWRAELFHLIRSTPHLVWLLLSKRPQNIVRMYDEAGGDLKNVAFGATCEDQQRYDINAKHLSYAKSALKPLFTFLSCEPLLGQIDMHLTPDDPLNPDWIITGGETDQGGHKARPTHPDWFRSLRDQAAAVGAAYHHKQNGEFLPRGQLFPRPFGTRVQDDPTAYQGLIPPVHGCAIDLMGTVMTFDAWWSQKPYEGPVPASNPEVMERVGKNRSGRLLDGVEYNSFPKVAA